MYNLSNFHQWTCSSYLDIFKKIDHFERIEQYPNLHCGRSACAAKVMDNNLGDAEWAPNALSHKQV